MSRVFEATYLEMIAADTLPDTAEQRNAQLVESRHVHELKDVIQLVQEQNLFVAVSIRPEGQKTLDDLH